MAVDWGSWDYGGGNGMRVGVDVSVESISHSEGAATFTVDYWTENQFNYSSDGQSLNLTGSIGGSIDFSNSASGSPVKRGTRTYTYNYPSGSYGSSPGSRTFGCKLSGAYNGVTPSTSHTSTIPARPIGSPAVQTDLVASWTTDTQINLSWDRTNGDSAGNPYYSQTVQRYDFSTNPSWTSMTSPSSDAHLYTDSGVVANRKYQYRIRANNSVGSSVWEYSNFVYTSPSAPPTCIRTSVGSGQQVSWTNDVGYTEYTTEVWHAVDGVWGLTPLTTVSSDVTSYTQTDPGAGAHVYKVRNVSTSGLTSPFSPDSTGTTTVPGPPAAPSGLAPNSETLDPTTAITFVWTHNPTDGSAQTKYTVRHRLQGASTWTTTAIITSSASSYTLTANTYVKGNKVEWQVMTYGSDPAGSPWSASAYWDTVATISVKYPVYLDLATGNMVADSSAAVAPGAPPARPVASGSFVLSPSAADTNTTLAVTFPVGRFSVPPIVSITPGTGIASYGITWWISGAPTTTGFTAVMRRSTTTATTFYWVAVGES